MRKKWWIPGVALLLVLLLGRPIAAGTLTANSYTYVLKGRQISMPVDILAVEGSYLVPSELLDAFKLVPEASNSEITLARGPVTVQMELGSDTALVDGQLRLLPIAPMEVNGRLFLPAAILPDLGANLRVDGPFAFLTDYLPAQEPAPQAADLMPLRQTHSLCASVREGSGMLSLSITALTPDLLYDPVLGIPWGTRLRLLSMLHSQTLLLVKASNSSLHATALNPKGLMLIGTDSRQYDYLNTEVEVDGAVTSLIAPGATQVSVLAFGHVTGPVFDLYHDGTAAMLGRLPSR